MAINIATALAAVMRSATVLLEASLAALLRALAAVIAITIGLL